MTFLGAKIWDIVRCKLQENEENQIQTNKWTLNPYTEWNFYVK